ncbi:MAG: hypothetical protein GF350_05235 [Chitinivibrionales bacterium]|nr:hypothetical protein [Chitinivibrionales bacterium]
MKECTICELMFIFVLMIAPAWCQDKPTSEQDTTAKKLEEVERKLMGYEELILWLQSTVKNLTQIKITGYIQAQARIAPDTIAGTNYQVGAYSGGAFPENTHKNFQLRRGRLKIKYKTDTTSAVFQLDIVPKGVSIKDAYLKFKDPWLKTFALQAGVFDRPFGFEIGYSSSRRESPERSRIIQTLFPREKDLGIALDIVPDEILMPLLLTYFNIKAGVFSGNGIADESDDNLDIIGRFGFSFPILPLNLSIDGGFSGYYGKITTRNDTVAILEDGRWSKNAGYSNLDLDRQYFGGDMQVYYNIPALGGFSLRGEVIGGQQPGRLTSSVSPKSSSAWKDIAYGRQFMGYYAMYIQNLGRFFQFVAKYDFYDPNIGLKGNEITSTGDLAYKTLGGGVLYYWGANLKFTAYYDYIMNEISRNVYTRDLKDNIFTFRIQYAF